MAVRLAVLNVMTSLAAAAAVGVPALRRQVPAGDALVYAAVIAVAVAAVQGALALAWWVHSDRERRKAPARTGSSRRKVRHLAAPPE
jgi:hypothetical protein